MLQNRYHYYVEQMKTNYILLYLLLLFPAQRIIAQSPEYQCIVVETTDGERMEYLLSDNPHIVHNDATVVLTTNSVCVEYQTSNVSKIFFSAVPTSIGEEKTSKGHFRLQQNMVILMGFGASEPVALYGAGGLQLWQQTTDSDGRLMLSLSTLPQGIFIVKTNNQSFKVTRK